MRRALSDIGVGADTQAQLWALLSGLLWLGNIEFEESGAGEGTKVRRCDCTGGGWGQGGACRVGARRADGGSGVHGEQRSSSAGQLEMEAWSFGGDGTLAMGGVMEWETGRVASSLRRRARSGRDLKLQRYPNATHHLPASGWSTGRLWADGHSLSRAPWRAACAAATLRVPTRLHAFVRRRRRLHWPLALYLPPTRVRLPLPSPSPCQSPYRCARPPRWTTLRSCWACRRRRW